MEWIFLLPRICRNSSETVAQHKSHRMYEYVLYSLLPLVRGGMRQAG